MSAELRTRQLTCGEYHVAPSGRRSFRLLPLVLALVAAGAFVAWQTRQGTPGAHLEAELKSLGEQNQALRQELEQLKLAATHEEATRKELQNQLEERATQIKKLQDDVNFFRSQRGANAAAASSPAPAR